MRVLFTDNFLWPANPLLRDSLTGENCPRPRQVSLTLDQGFVDAQPNLAATVDRYFARCPDTNLVCPPFLLEGGKHATP